MGGVELKEAIKIHSALEEYRDLQYINLVQQINTKVKAELTNDMGSQFLANCGRDLAGEVVRNFFDASDYYITVDQLATRILKFDYENEYDPLTENNGIGNIKKSVYNYDEHFSKRISEISDFMDANQEQLFTNDRKQDSLDRKGKLDYRNSKYDENGSLYDELTGREGSNVTILQNGKKVLKSDLHADHIQSRESAKYNSRYISENGINELKKFYNSSDNMQLMHASANTSKGDIRVCKVNGKILYLNTKDARYNPATDITHRATPEQLASATIEQWEKGDVDSNKIQTLLNKGYLVKDKNGKVHVPKAIRKKLEANIRESQNKESVVILKNANYKNVAVDAANRTKRSIGKIIAGQLIYYVAPPLIYEIKNFLKNKKAKLQDVINNLKDSTARIGHYVLSKLSEIFKNVIFNTLKNFIKIFMDILINLVKATVKKILNVAKKLVLSTVDAVKIIADKSSSPAEKADAVFNLYGVTITSCVIDVIFSSIKMPEPIIAPLQILATVICTNLTMLILQEADLFDVRFGFKINNIK